MHQWAGHLLFVLRFLQFYDSIDVYMCACVHTFIYEYNPGALSKT